MRALHRTSQLTKMFALLCAVILVLTACGGQSGSDSKAAEDKTPAADTTSYTVKHAMGETTIKGTPKRIVVLTNEGTEAVLALGIKPIGAVKSFTGDPWYDHIKADMEGVTVLGEESQPNIEMIASLKPDLILGNKMRQEKVYQQLSAIAPTVFSETLRGEWKSNFSLYAEALGKKTEGEQVLTDFDKKIEDFKAKAGDKLNEKVSVVRFMGGKTRIYLSDTFTGIIFKQIGIARPETNYKDTFVEEITKERIPEVDADMMLYFTYETGDDKGNKQAEEFMNDPLWQNLNVVKNKKAFKVDDAIFNTAGGVRAANLMVDELYNIYGLQK